MLKKMVVEPKTAQPVEGSTQSIEESTQPVEPAEKLVNLFSSTS